MRNDSFVLSVHDVGNDFVNDFNDIVGYIPDVAEGGMRRKTRRVKAGH